jgi:uncharacterized Zn-binding protein involved in type VI secretion
MGQAAAKQGDTITAMDTHIVMVPSPGGPVATPTPGHIFNGSIDNQLSPDVYIHGKPAATQDSMATNQPPHLPIGGPSFQVTPTNQGRVVTGSASVFLNKKPAARHGDSAVTCDDVAPLAPKGTVVAPRGLRPVLIGG